MVLLLKYSLRGNIWQTLELEPKLWTKVGPKRAGAENK